MQSSSGVRTPSPVKVVITRVESPVARTNSGRHGSGRTKSPVLSTQRRGSLQPMGTRSVTSRLHVPGLNDSMEKLTLNGKTMGNNSSNSVTPRSRSSSPFNIDRERLPTGSPTFQRVLYDILAETEIDLESTDDERSSKERQPSLHVPKPRKKTPVDTRRRMSLSPSVHFRRKSLY